MRLETEKYPKPLQELISPLAELRFDFSVQISQGVQPSLDRVALEDFFPRAISNQKMAKCCHSGLWLLHGFLDESHKISQSIHTPEGSYWHAIMHRAERDYWNSKHWYRKVGTHPVLDGLNSNGVSGEQLVDLCEQATGSNPTQERASELVKLEWALLFDYCWNQATHS